MVKLEQYLDQVCRSIGGPAALREHVRQEMREHLLDAVAQHQAAGMSGDESLQKALAEFGKPDDMRQELELTHGRRMAWLIEKGLEWKEKVLKARWLWATWSYLALAAVVFLEVVFMHYLTFGMLPANDRLLRDGMIDRRIFLPDALWISEVLDIVRILFGRGYFWFLVCIAVAAWCTFEWRVRSDNKPFMRLAALGTTALMLFLLIALTAMGLLESSHYGRPVTSFMLRPYVTQQIDTIDKSVESIEKARQTEDWEIMQLHAIKASQTMIILQNQTPLIPSLATTGNRPQHELRNAVHLSLSHLHTGYLAIEDKNGERLNKSLVEFQKTFEPLRDAAKKVNR